MTTANWGEDKKNREILQIIKDGIISHYYRATRTTSTHFIWEIHKYIPCKDQPDKFTVTETVFQGSLTETDRWLTDKEAEIQGNRMYNVQNIKETAQDIVDRLNKHTELSKTDFDKTAGEVVSILLALVNIDDEIRDKNFIDFVEHYTWH